jgi:hypothetical protein
VRVYAIHAASPTGASNPAFVQVFNVASGGVTLGTTRADIAFKVPAAKSVTLLFLPGNDDTIFSTALTFGATTTAGGATGVAGADTPVVTVLANK